MKTSPTPLVSPGTRFEAPDLNATKRPSALIDGTHVAFTSITTDLVSGDTNSVGDVFIAYGPATLLADGFESGDLSAWSLVVP